MEQYGGNPDCVTATPEIEVMQLTPDIDFILLGSDGVYDRLENHQINIIVQSETLQLTKQIERHIKPSSFEHMSNCCGAAVNGVLKSAMDHESTDNLSVVLIAFKNF